jgi:hypothetical protein
MKRMIAVGIVLATVGMGTAPAAAGSIAAFSRRLARLHGDLAREAH